MNIKVEKGEDDSRASFRSGVLHESNTHKCTLIIKNVESGGTGKKSLSRVGSSKESCKRHAVRFAEQEERDEWFAAITKVSFYAQPSSCYFLSMYLSSTSYHIWSSSPSHSSVPARAHTTHARTHYHNIITCVPNRQKRNFLNMKL